MPPSQTEASAEQRSARAVLLAFRRLAGGWWGGETAGTAWRLSLGLAGLLVLNIGISLCVNQWNRAFFDALEQRSGRTLGLLVVALVAVVVLVAVVGVFIVIVRETLQVRWRQWLVGRLTDSWLARQRFYRLPLAGLEPANPEYRIADDSRMATEPVVDFVIGLVHALLTALAFVGILWSVGGGIDVPLGGMSIHVPAYLMLAALAYGAAASWLTLRVGRPLIGAVAQRNEAEARLRFELTRLRENAESIAMIGGEGPERGRIGHTYTTLVERWLAVVALHGRLTWITNASGTLVPVIPLLLAAPKYLSGELSLGAVTQLAAAFTQVQVAIAWLVDNYKQVAQWHASAERVLALGQAVEELEQPTTISAIARREAPDGTIGLTGVVIADRTGRLLVRDLDLVIAPGDRVLIMGESGAGKSTVLRALVGLWPWGEGTAAMPAGLRLGYAPQHPYLPLGTLRDALAYPGRDAPPPDERMAEALVQCNLPELRHRLDQVERWDRILSQGEIQRLGFARLLLQRPDCIIMDEATSGLDELSQAQLMAVLLRECPEATIISIGHRPSLRPFHTRCFLLRKGNEGSIIEEEPQPGPVRAALQAVRTA
ncbi:MAG TPA: ABC transporter ATP-binding protein/permease [Microvirga sp.]|jgi:putative ATP-binding cassette transporter